MSENLIRQFNNKTLDNNLNQKDLNVLPSNDIMTLNSDINKTILKLDEIFVKLFNNESYKDKQELISLKSKYDQTRKKYVSSIKMKDYSEFGNVKNIMDEISKSIVEITTTKQEIKEPIQDKVEQNPSSDEEVLEEDIELIQDNSIKKKGINDEIRNCNINISNIQNIISEFEKDLERKERYLNTNRPYLDSIEVYGFEKAIQNTKQKIENQRKLLEQETKKLKKKVSELNELNDIEMAPTEVFDNLKEQMELFKEKERIESQIADLQNKVPEEYYSDMINNSKKVNL